MLRPPYIFHRPVYRTAPPRRRRSVPWAYALLLALPLGLFLIPGSKPSASRAEALALEEPDAPPVATLEIAPLQFGYPTAQTNLLVSPPTADVFMPTASGRPESALYGSVRTEAIGRSLYARFHEGVDIAPTARDARNRPLDDVFAAADGRVAYLNSIPGNSDYGRYVVLEHRDPLGRILTLYAHLESIASGIRRGVDVRRGTVLGRMGHSPEAEIPLARAHTHFEIGVMANPYFDSWFRRQKLKPDHGLYNGGNLLCVDPLDVYRAQADGKSFTMRDYLPSLPAACELVLKTRGTPPYFRLYPQLWSGDPGAPGPVVVRLSEGGVPLSGRRATEEEARALGKQAAAVLAVDPQALGRNGRRIVVQDGGRWRLGRNGERWVQQFMYIP